MPFARSLFRVTQTLYVESDVPYLPNLPGSLTCHNRELEAFRLSQSWNGSPRGPDLHSGRLFLRRQSNCFRLHHMHKPRVLTGTLAGGLLTAPLIAVFYLGWKLFALPFVPFNVFDWLARVLPGPVLTFGIDSMVRIIRSLNLGRTDEAAKIAEQSMAVILFLVAGIFGGAILFSVLRRLEKGAVLFGTILGVLLAAVVLAIGESLGRTRRRPCSAQFGPW